jgi:TonB family protein
MSASRARKIMLAAIAISLLLHLLLAGYIRWPFNQSNETPIVKVRRITIARVVPHTPPPPPSPTPIPTARPSATAKVVPPATTSHGSKGPPVAHAIAPPVVAKTTAPTATPAPTAAPTLLAQACLQHDISPAVSATAQPVDIPPQARASKTNGIASIQVQIDPQGHVTDASVSQSSGDAGLDAVAMQMAKGATYTPGLVKCKPVASAYTYKVKFVAW